MHTHIDNSTQRGTIISRTAGFSKDKENKIPRGLDLSTRLGTTIQLRHSNPPNNLLGLHAHICSLSCS